MPTTADYCGHIPETYNRQMLTASWDEPEELVKSLTVLIMLQRLVLPTHFLRFCLFVAYKAVFYSYAVISLHGSTCICEYPHVE